MDDPQTPDSLSRALQDWRVAPSRNPQFRPAVWAKIAAAQKALPWPQYARRHAVATFAALALAVVAGGVLGREQARTRTAQASAQMAANYVQGLDARQMQMP